MPNKERSNSYLEYLRSSQAASQVLEGQISTQMRNAERILWGAVGFLLSSGMMLVLVSRF